MLRRHEVKLVNHSLRNTVSQILLFGSATFSLHWSQNSGLLRCMIWVEHRGIVAKLFRHPVNEKRYEEK